MRSIVTTMIMTVCTLFGYAQSNISSVEQERELQKDVGFINQKKLKDERDVVGVAAFKCDQESPFIGLVTEKVVEVLKNSNRFIIVDRTHMDKVNEEMDFQKREEFIGRTDLAEQGNNLAAKRIVQGTITKIPVYRIKNSDGSVRGYKASVAFELKVDNVETGETTQATSFEAKASKECISPEAAIQMAMNNLQDDMAEYFRVTFPLTSKIMKIISEKNGIAEYVLVKAGTKHGIKVGDKFTLKTIEILDGEEIPTELGQATVTKLTGDAFSECKVDKKAGKDVYEKFNANVKIICSLIIKK